MGDITAFGESANDGDSCGLGHKQLGHQAVTAGGWLPPTKLWILGSLAWGLAMAASFLLSIHVFGRAVGSHDLGLTALYAGGGLLGWLVALPLIHLITDMRRPSKVLAGWVLLLGVVTIGATAGLYALQYRYFYAHWHAPFATRIWFYQLIYTTAVALYQFAVLGVRHLLPAGFAMLLVLSFVMARRSR